MGADIRGDVNKWHWCSYLLVPSPPILARGLIWKFSYQPLYQPSPAMSAPNIVHKNVKIVVKIIPRALSPLDYLSRSKSPLGIGALTNTTCPLFSCVTSYASCFVVPSESLPCSSPSPPCSFRALLTDGWRGQTATQDHYTFGSWSRSQKCRQVLQYLFHTKYFTNSQMKTMNDPLMPVPRM